MLIPVAAAGTMVVVGLRPEVKGASFTELAPEKAGAWVAFEGSGIAVVAAGLRTLHMRRM
jgi:hypothetical protein